MLYELLTAELDARRRLGEQPEPGDYHERFPADAEVIDAAFTPPEDSPDPQLFVDLLGVWFGDSTRSFDDARDRFGAPEGFPRELLDDTVAEHPRPHNGALTKEHPSLTSTLSGVDLLEHMETKELKGGLDLLEMMTASTMDGSPQSNPPSTFGVDKGAGDRKRFRVLRPHSRGGLGAVFVAMDQELHREVALKEILDRHADDPACRSRFLREAEITGGLEHPGIVPVYGLGTGVTGRPYYAMRLIRGDTLMEAIERFHGGPPGSRDLELRKLLRRFLDVCNAIDYAHSRGVLHRDLKPRNVIVGKHGETLVVDWGLAKALGNIEQSSNAEEPPLSPASAVDCAETLPGSAMGTPAYMSPEQAAGELERLGPRADVYSLGATLYCMLTGRPPVDGDDLDEVLRRVRDGMIPPPRAIDPKIDKALEAVCLKAMALHPVDRYGSARELADDVERWMADEPVAVHREPFSTRITRWGRRNQMVAGASARC